jgi:hypothetical protein
MEKIKRLPSGISDFEVIRRDNLYYVDKTRFLSVLEGGDSYVFYGRPRRFGKSLFISMMEAYYDIKQKDRFDELFSGLWIHEHPTERRAFYQVLRLDFSKVNGNMDNVETNFNSYCGNAMIDFAQKYEDMYYKGFVEDVKNEPNATERINIITGKAKLFGHPLYLIIDEYDNFTNTILSLYGEAVYEAITHGEGFYREVFKKFKGGFERIFLTGVSPVTLDDLTSGFNIASYVSQEAKLNQMLGFSESDVKEMIAYYHSVGMIKGDLQQQTDFLINSIKPWCDNYCFSLMSFEAGEPPMYNGMMVMFYLNRYMTDGRLPDDMTVPNALIDYNKLDHLIKLEKANKYRESFIMKAVEEEYIVGQVKDHFRASKLIEDENFISLMYYYGMLTIKGKFGFRFKLSIPNNNIRKLYYTYILENYAKYEKIDVSHLQDTFDSAAMFGKWHDMFGYIAEIYKDNTSNRNALDGERAVQMFYMAYFSLNPYYLLCPELEFKHGYGDVFLMPEKRLDYVKHSYIVEFKYVNADSKEKDIQDKYDEAINQLKTYSAAPQVKNMTEGTKLHQLVVIFKGFDAVKMEEV